jgi:flavin reductase (DIM6/NTAB) family NADH-FMN oxidoreductase RutF
MSNMPASSPLEDQRAFRRALGHFGTGVALVTAKTSGTPLGSTISSFNSVSLDPPLILFSLRSDSLAIDQWREASALCVSVLADDQIDTSNRFAKAGTDKWADVEIVTGLNGAPIIPGSIAYFECAPYAVYDGGDHDIFLCRVSSYWASDRQLTPLLFYAGQYRQLAPVGGQVTPPLENMWLHGW